MRKTIEQRVAALEKEFAALRQGDVPAEAGTSQRKPRMGWLKTAGWAKDDPIYDEAMKIGAAWRQKSK